MGFDLETTIMSLFATAVLLICLPPPSEKEKMMQYMIMAYENESAFASRAGDEKEKYWGAWAAYTKLLLDAGIMKSGHGLQPPVAGTTVRLRDGRRQVQDGPFADTKEQLGGYYVIDVANLDMALDWAAKCPAAAYAAVEVRPVLTR